MNTKATSQHEPRERFVDTCVSKFGAQPSPITGLDSWAYNLGRPGAAAA